MPASPIPRNLAQTIPLVALGLAVLLALPAPPVRADDVGSAYTRLDLDNGCRWDELSEEEAEMAGGNCAWCPGHGDVAVRFCEGDLRQSIQYGPIDPQKPVWSGFGEFNHAGETIEWRLRYGRPFAAIQRFFIENINPDTGAIEETRRGQVLVVSTVATADNPVSCPAGYVDARANSDANAIARQVADNVAAGFRCGVDEAQFHGIRGPHAGSPTGFYQQ